MLIVSRLVFWFLLSFPFFRLLFPLHKLPLRFTPLFFTYYQWNVKAILPPSFFHWEALAVAASLLFPLLALQVYFSFPGIPYKRAPLLHCSFVSYASMVLDSASS